MKGAALKGIGSAKKKKAVQSGFRNPRTAAEQQFWDRNKPDYRAWALKKGLTDDEVCALAMGLDPKCVDEIPSETGQTPARFKATKAWFKKAEADFGRTSMDVLGINVWAMDKGLPVPCGLSDAAHNYSEGFLDQDKRIAKLGQKIRSQQKTIERLRCVIARTAVKSGVSLKVTRRSDQTRSDKTTSKLIIALLAEVMRRNNLNVSLELTRLKNGANNKCVSQALSTLPAMEWAMDEDTVKPRLAAAINEWKGESE